MEIATASPLHPVETLPMLYALGFLGLFHNRRSDGRVSGNPRIGHSSTILAVGYLLPFLYLTWSLKYGEIAGANPWQAAGLEWTVQSPPPKENIARPPIVNFEAYDYERVGKPVETVS